MPSAISRPLNQEAYGSMGTSILCNALSHFLGIEPTLELMDESLLRLRCILRGPSSVKELLGPRFMA